MATTTTTTATTDIDVIKDAICAGLESLRGQQLVVKRIGARELETEPWRIIKFDPVRKSTAMTTTPAASGVFVPDRLPVVAWARMYLPRSRAEAHALARNQIIRELAAIPRSAVPSGHALALHYAFQDAEPFQPTSILYVYRICTEPMPKL